MPGRGGSGWGNGFQPGRIRGVGTAAESFFKGDAARYVRGKDIATVRIVPEDAGEGLTWNLFDLQMFAVLENKGEMSQ